MREFTLKRSIGVLTLLLICLDGSNAQLIRGYGFKIAVTSASHSYEYSNPPWPGFGPKTVRRVGVNAGFFVEWLDLPFFSVLTPVEYTQRGVGHEYVLTLNDPTPIGKAVDYRRVDYVSIPILLKMRVSLGLLEAYVFVGPRADILLGYQEDVPNISSVYKDFKKLTTGGSFGIGIESDNLLLSSLFLEIRYNADFMDSYDKGILKVRNNAFDVWLGIAL